MSSSLAATLTAVPAALVLLSLGVFVVQAARRPRDPDAVARGGKRLLGLFFRDFWYWLHGPAERWALRSGLNPDALTLAGLGVTVAAALAFAFGWFAVGGWLIVLGGSFDILDGRIARQTGTARPAGAFLDSSLDRYGDFVLFAGLAVAFRQNWGLMLALLALGGSFLVSYARARAEALGAECRDGWFQRAERMLFLAAGGILAPVIAWAAGISQTTPMLAVLGLLALMTNLTAFGRVRSVYRRLDEMASQSTPVSERT